MLEGVLSGDEEHGTFWRKEALDHEEKERIEDIWPLEA
jgi:hypothetical protein